MKQLKLTNNAQFTLLITLALIMGYLYSLNAQPINPKFQKVSIEQGLSQVNINCMIQDKNGYLWIGTDDGLNKYDGYGFEVFQYEPHNPESITGNVISYLLEDGQGKIWFSTENGIGYYNPREGTFETLSMQVLDSTIEFQEVLTLARGNKNEIWLGMGDHLYTVDTEEISLHPQWSFSEYGIFVESITSMLVEKKQKWIATDQGLYHVQQGTSTPKKLLEGNTFYIYKAISGDVYVLQENGIYRINTQGEVIAHYAERFYIPRNYHSLMVEDIFSEGNFWVYGDFGLSYLETATGNFSAFTHNPNESSSISSNAISSLLFDKYGILWVGNTHRGLNKLNPSKGILEHYYVAPNSALSLSHNDVYSFLEDSDKNIWVGTRNGLNKLSADRKTIEHYFNKRIISALLKGDDDKIWVGTDNGLFHFDPSDGSAVQYWNNCSDEAVCFYKNGILCLKKGKNNKIWLGTVVGIFLFDTNTRTFERPPIEEIGLQLSEYSISAINWSKDNTLWIGTEEAGIFHYNPHSNSIKNYTFEEGNKNSLSHNAVFGSYVENDSIVWMITYGGGLNRLNYQADQFTVFTSSNSALKTNSLDALQVDKNGLLWIGTDNGLLRFDPKTFDNHLFGPKDGLQGKEFHQKGAGITRNGELMFGGVNGMNIFTPDALNDFNPISPEVHITSAKTLVGNNIDKEAESAVDISPLSTLPHYRNDIEFSFVGLHYLFPEGNTYKVKLEPYEKEWRDVGNLKQATYTNLDPDSYTFMVKAANSDGIWRETPASFTFTISKPWWQTYWFYFLVVCLLVFTFYLIRRYEIRRLRLAAAFDAEKLEAERLKQLDKTKSDFFANISHEFRTPLTVILGELENILEKADIGFKRGLRVSQTNAQKLLVLINQLLDLSKLEAGGLSPQKEEIDLFSFLKNQLYSLESLAVAKNINLVWGSNLALCLVEFDTDMLGKIANNLLSNAIKFTPIGGVVKLIVEKGQKEDEVLIHIEDTGPGIPTEHKEKIFNRFYQVNSGVARTYEGTGIGLALTKELVQLHGGDISVKSDGKSGSIFSVRLKCKQQILGQKETISLVKTLEKIKEPLPDFQTIQFNSEKPIIQIVEDNQDVRSYLKSCLADTFQIVEAANGKIGLKQAKEVIPDLIVTDVMMPEMDGFTFSTQIKTDQRTSHIPIIILTARSGEEEKIEGLNKGVDDFLTKPFSKRELLIRIENLLKIRQLLKEKYKDSSLSNTKELELSSVDQQFLNKIYTFIDEHIDDEQLGVSSLAQLVHMSESQLNRKLKALVGHPPGIIIRSKRLKLAAELLKKKAGTVSQIAFMVGFSDLATFTRSFKREFGQPPSKYLQSV